MKTLIEKALDKTVIKKDGKLPLIEASELLPDDGITMPNVNGYEEMADDIEELRRLAMKYNATILFPVQHKYEG